MTDKEKKMPGKKKSRAGSSESAYWKAAIIVGLIAAAGLVMKTMSSSGPVPGETSDGYQQVPRTGKSIEKDVRRVASNFRCACGGCGELPLDSCECDMRRGAVEEKAFIRKQLRKGLSVESVVELLDREYGHRNA